MLLLEIYIPKKPLIYLSCFVILSITFIQVESNRTVLDKSLAIKIRTRKVVVVNLNMALLNLQQCLSRSYFFQCIAFTKF